MAVGLPNKRKQEILCDGGMMSHGPTYDFLRKL